MTTKFECYLEPIAYGLSVFLCDQGWKAKVLGKAVVTDYPKEHADCFKGHAIIQEVEPTEEDIKCLGM